MFSPALSAPSLPLFAHLLSPSLPFLPSPSVHSLLLGVSPIPCVVSHQTVQKRLKIYVFGPGVPKGNFIENKGDSRTAQITHEEERDNAAPGALLPHWRTLLLDYWFTAQNGRNVSRVKLINPPPAVFMKMDLLSVIILMDCYDRTLTVLCSGCLRKKSEHRDGRGEVWGRRADRMTEAGLRRRREVSTKMNTPK